MAKAFGYPPAMRLRSKAEIDTIFRSGRYHRLGWLQAKTRPSEGPQSRFLISVARRAGNAPARNRVKRVVREAVRLHRNALTSPHDVCLFVTRPPQGAVRLEEVARDLCALFGRLAPQTDARIHTR